MPWFATAYWAEGRRESPLDRDGTPKVGAYGFTVWANSRRHALRLCRRRGLGERIYDGPTRRPFASFAPPSALLRKRPPSVPAAVHSAMLLGWLALNTNAATMRDLLGDAGVIHDLAHLLHHGASGRHREDSDWRPRALARRFAEIERRIPGYSPR